MDEIIQEESSTSDKVVPYDRFAEVIKEKNELKQKLEEQSKPSVNQDNEDKEVKAKNYLKTLTKETLEEVKREEIAQRQAEEKEIEKEISNTLELNPDIKKTDFTKFLSEKAEIYGIKSIDGAMKLYREINNLSKDVADKTKKDILGKPVMPKSEGGGESISYEKDFKGKSWGEITETMKKSLK